MNKKANAYRIVCATNYPFAKLMEIAESVPTGRGATNECARCLNFYNFTRAL